MNYKQSDVKSVPVSTINKLPKNSNILGIYEGVEDMNDNKHTVLKVIWTDRGLRTAFFDLHNGEYLGDTLS